MHVFSDETSVPELPLTLWNTHHHVSGETMSITASAKTNPGEESKNSARPTSRWMPGVNTIAFGGDYNPEQWPREVWDEDVRLMDAFAPTANR